MSYSKEDISTPGSFIQDQLRQSDKTVANDVNTWDTAKWDAAGWREDMFPDKTQCQYYPDVPDAINDLAVWSPLDLPQEECDALRKQALQDQILAQVPNPSVADTVRDTLATDNLKVALLQKTSALNELDLADPADYETFPTELSAYAPDNAAYAAVLADREEANLATPSMYTTAQVATVTDRAAANRAISTSQTAASTPPQVPEPTSGAERQFVSLANETPVEAFIREAVIDWNGTPYYLPQVSIPFIPENVNQTLVYASLYDDDGTEDGHYRSWLPFEQQPDGTWRTPANVSYISNAKTTPGAWRVAVCNGHTSQEYEITTRGILNEGATLTPVIRFD